METDAGTNGERWKGGEGTEGPGGEGMRGVYSRRRVLAPATRAVLYWTGGVQSGLCHVMRPADLARRRDIRFAMQGKGWWPAHADTRTCGLPSSDGQSGGASRQNQHKGIGLGVAAGGPAGDPLRVTSASSD